MQAKNSYLEIVQGRYQNSFFLCLLEICRCGGANIVATHPEIEGRNTKKMYLLIRPAPTGRDIGQSVGWATLSAHINILVGIGYEKSFI